MRDFKANGDIKIEGNVVINDYSSQEHKPLVQCNIEELEAEQYQRQNLLKEERIRERNISFNFVKFAVIVGLALSLWYMVSGESNIAMYIIGIFGVLVPILVSIMDREPTDFENRQLKVLQEIEYLLMEKR